jgi:hypothetical protein
MGSVDLQLARELRDRLGLTRAVETGTFRGRTALALAKVFPSVVTIEISAELASAATVNLADVSAITVLQGHSVSCLAAQRRSSEPSLYYLDGHFSGGNTGGAEDECPVLKELETIGDGHPHDCFVIDDARLFASSPAPPHDPDKWPELIEIFDLLRSLHSEHIVTVLNDQVVAVPRPARPVLNAYGLRVQPPAFTVRDQLQSVRELIQKRLKR